MSGRARAGAILLIAFAGAAAQEAPAPLRARASWADASLAARVRERLATGSGREGDAPPLAEGRGQETARDESGGPLEGAAGLAGSARWIGLLVLGAALAAAVIAIARHLRRAREEEGAAAPARAPAEEAASLEVGDRRLEAGDVAGAIAAYHRFARGRLRASGHVPLAEHHADGLIAAAIDEERLRRPFRALSGRFQPVRYGARPASTEDAALARDAAVAIDEGVRLRAPEGIGA